MSSSSSRSWWVSLQTGPPAPQFVREAAAAGAAPRSPAVTRCTGATDAPCVKGTSARAVKILDGFATVGKKDPNGPRPPFRMPGWTGQMTDAEVADLVEYLFSLYPKSAGDKWR